MQRITEPELMNEEIQTDAYAQADFKEPNIHFINLFQKTFSKNITGNVLDIGCGNADITLRFARAFPNCYIDAIDGSRSMLKHGSKALERESENIQKRVTFVQGIVPSIKLPRPHYDTIISNSVLHHIHEPILLWQFIKSHSTQNTKIFIGDLLRPTSKEKAAEIVELYAINEPEILKVDFYNSLLAAFEISEIEEQLESSGMSNLSVRQISDRHVIISGSFKS